MTQPFHGDEKACSINLTQCLDKEMRMSRGETLPNMVSHLPKLLYLACSEGDGAQSCMLLIHFEAQIIRCCHEPVSINHLATT